MKVKTLDCSVLIKIELLSAVMTTKYFFRFVADNKNFLSSIMGWQSTFAIHHGTTKKVFLLFTWDEKNICHLIFIVQSLSFVVFVTKNFVGE